VYIKYTIRNSNEEAIGAKLRVTSVRSSGSISENNKLFSLRQSFQTESMTHPLYFTTGKRDSLPNSEVVDA
jgi:hypothetical protein